MRSNEDLIGRYATYCGKNRAYLFGNKPLEIIAANSRSVQLDIAGGQWVALTSVSVIDPEPKGYDMTDEQMDEMFNNAAGSKEDRLDAEIKRLEARLTELKAARKVLDSI